MIISPPDTRGSKGCEVQGFIIQLHVGEDARFKEENVGIKCEPQVPRENSLEVRYVRSSLSTRDIRDGKM